MPEMAIAGAVPSQCATVPINSVPKDQSPDRKSTRLNSSHLVISYAVFCLKKKIRRFFGAAKEPMLTAYVTRSSSGSLPVSMRAAEKLGISESTYGFSLPLGATIHMDRSEE